MRPYPKLIRLAVLRASDAGLPTMQVAKKFGCSRAWVRRVKQQRRELGKRGPYRIRRSDRQTAALRDRIKYAIIEEPSLTVEEVQRIFHTELTMGQVSGIREELYVNDDIYWRGAEHFLPPGALKGVAEAVHRQILRGDLLKKQIKDLLAWKPAITADELEAILGSPANPEWIAEARDELEIKQARLARAEALRKSQQTIESWNANSVIEASYRMYPSL